ncbi:unnamed protein product [Rhizopus stolonifer]
MNNSQSFKRKSELKQDNNSKRLHVLPSMQDHSMNEASLPPRPTTPPLGMTLSHYNPATGSYVSSQLKSEQEIKSSICSGMTPIYQSPIEPWGSSLL